MNLLYHTLCYPSIFYFTFILLYSSQLSPSFNDIFGSFTNWQAVRRLSIQEKLKDLRVEKGLSLEELAAETELSKSALGSYETTDHKDISHTSIIALAKFYGVSAEMQIRNLNSFVALIRSKIQMRVQILDSEHYLRTLKACEIDEDNYFSRRIFEDISAIAKDIKQSHRRDTETGDENDSLTDVIDIVEEYAAATGPMKATLSTLSKQLGMNFNKMDPTEVQFFTTLVEKYSTSYRSMLPKKGRGKK